MMIAVLMTFTVTVCSYVHSENYWLLGYYNLVFSFKAKTCNISAIFIGSGFAPLKILYFLPKMCLY